MRRVLCHVAVAFMLTTVVACVPRAQYVEVLSAGAFRAVQGCVLGLGHSVDEAYWPGCLRNALEEFGKTAVLGVVDRAVDSIFDDFGMEPVANAAREAGIDPTEEDLTQEQLRTEIKLAIESDINAIELSDDD